MSSSKERYILNNIRHSVEAETPDVWDKIKGTDKCKFDSHEGLIKSKSKKIYAPVMAAALCAVMILAGIKTRFFNIREQIREPLTQSIGQDSAKEIMPSDSKGGDCEIFNPYTRDADIEEASKAFGINVVEPAWMPQGFTKVSAKLYSNDKDWKHSYMYNIEYRKGKTLFAVTITKYNTASMPKNVDEGDSGAASSNAVGAEAADKQMIPPDAPVQSKPGSNSIEPVSPPENSCKASDMPARLGEASSGNSGTSNEGEVISTQLISTKIKNIEVSMVVIDSKEKGALSASWIYEGGSYSIFTDGVSKDDMVKVVESMIE